MTAADQERMIQVVFLSGPRRGQTDGVVGRKAHLGFDASGQIVASADGGPVSDAHLASLVEVPGGYRVDAPGAANVLIAGQPADGQRLTRTDVLSLGTEGTIVRVRSRAAERPYKRLDQAVADCVGCAIHGARGPVNRMAVLARGLGHAIRAEISPLARMAAGLVMAGMAVAVGALWQRNTRLEARLDDQASLLDSMAMSLPDAGEAAQLGEQRIETLRAELEEARGRLADLEYQAGARTRAIAQAAASVIFLQGSYGFVEPASGRTLRVAAGGAPGRTSVTLGGAGEPYQIRYTGTGFVASDLGHVITNRHVALPWEFDQTSRELMEAGLSPVMLRLQGYLPGDARAFDVQVVEAHAEADVALLVCDGSTAEVPYLTLSAAEVPLGTEVIVLGYPAGIQALLARADAGFVEAEFRRGPVDFWQAAERLASAGYIRPLATVGVIGQSTAATLVYDAETTHGGSGGPVIGLDGRVVAINAAIIPEFGGSNLGVPAAYALELLERASAVSSPLNQNLAILATRVAERYGATVDLVSLREISTSPSTDGRRGLGPQPFDRRHGGLI